MSHPSTDRKGKKTLRGLWRSEELDGLKPTVFDWARLAAFIDGEGTIDINTSRAHPSFTARIIIGNTNPKLAMWLIKTFGGSVKLLKQSDKYRTRWKDQYIWYAMSTRAAWCLFNAQPWMLLKDAQAELLMALQTNIDSTKQGRGRTVSSESIELRKRIKDDLHMLNAKGPSNQIVMTKEDFDGPHVRSN